MNLNGNFFYNFSLIENDYDIINMSAEKMTWQVRKAIGNRQQ